MRKWGGDCVAPSGMSAASAWRSELPRFNRDPNSDTGHRRNGGCWALCRTTYWRGACVAPKRRLKPCAGNLEFRSSTPGDRHATAAQDALLGQQSDEDIARRLNRTGLSVASRRFKLHIPKPHSKRPPWTPQQERWLGKLSDVEIARRTGHTLQGIGFRRRRLGLSDPTRRRPWTPNDDRRLGTAPDAQLARRLGRTVSAVINRRQKLGVRKFQSQAARPWTPEEFALLGTLPDRQLAQCFNRSYEAVAAYRLKKGIAAFRHPRKISRR